jgi:hypothetical protein
MVFGMQLKWAKQDKNLEFTLNFSTFECNKGRRPNYANENLVHFVFSCHQLLRFSYTLFEKQIRSDPGHFDRGGNNIVMVGKQQVSILFQGGFFNACRIQLHTDYSLVFSKVYF